MQGCPLGSIRELKTTTDVYGFTTERLGRLGSGFGDLGFGTLEPREVGGLTVQFWLQAEECLIDST